MRVIWLIRHYATREPIENALKETEMWNVYREIELPIDLYTGFHGKMGDSCQRRGTVKLMERESEVRIAELGKADLRNRRERSLISILPNSLA